MQKSLSWAAFAVILASGACSADPDGDGETESGAPVGPASADGSNASDSVSSDNAATDGASSSFPSGGNHSSETGADRGSDLSSSSGAPSDPRHEALLFRGGNGVTAIGDDWRFDLLARRLASTGRTLTEALRWPASLEDVGLVLLPVNADPFSADQVADLREVLDAGGVVIVHDEWSYYAQTENLNALLAALSSSLTFQAGLYADAQGGTLEVDAIGAHPLMAGVESMRVAAGSAVVGCDDAAALLHVEGVCYLAAESHGAGLLLTFGDANVLDDHAMSVAGPAQNVRFLDNLIAALPVVR
jgi:hypothetical protein